MKPTQLYSLTRKETFERARTTDNSSQIKTYRNWPWHALIALVLLGVAVLVPRVLYGEDDQRINYIIYTGVGLFLWCTLYFMVTIYIMAGRALYKNLQKQMTIERLAADNGMVFVDKIKPDDTLSEWQQESLAPVYVEGSFINLSRYPSLKNVVSSSKLLVAECVSVDRGDSSFTPTFWTVASYRLSRKLPHLIFDASGGDGVIGYSSALLGYTQSQKIKLEYGFDDHFKLYTPEGYEMDTLSFITPEVMHYMTENLTKFDVEIIDDAIFLYTKGKPQPEDYQIMYEKLHGFALEIEDNVKTYRDDRANPIDVDPDAEGSSQQPLYSNQPHSIDESGRRLRRPMGLYQVIRVLTYIALSLLVFLFLSQVLSG